MALPGRFVLRIRQVNTYTAAHLMVSGHEKYSKHVRYCSIDCLALSLCSHLCGLYLRTWSHQEPLSQLALPEASDQFFLQ